MLWPNTQPKNSVKYYEHWSMAMSTSDQCIQIIKLSTFILTLPLLLVYYWETLIGINSKKLKTIQNRSQPNLSPQINKS